LEENLGDKGEAIVGDTSKIVQDIMLDEALPVSQQGQNIHKRAAKLFLTMLLIGFWAAVLTWGLSLCFFQLSQASHMVVGWMDSFAEGLSGGAFLATIAGTMLPRIQQDAYRTGWSKDKSKILGLILFEFGLLTVVVLDLWLD